MRTRLWISIILLWVVWAAVKPLAAPTAQSVLWQIEHISPEYAYPDGAYVAFMIHMRRCKARFHGNALFPHLGGSGYPRSSHRAVLC